MARQEGPFRFNGRIGDISFYYDKDRGWLARVKGGPTDTQIKTSPKMAGTRNGNSEFGRMSTTAKRLRQKFGAILIAHSDSGMVNRFNSRISRIQKADPINERGKRKFLTANSRMLKGFEFNKQHTLESLFMGRLVLAYDRETSQAVLDIPAFNPRSVVKATEDATHMQFIFIGTDLDVQYEGRQTDAVVHSQYIPLIGDFPGERLSITVPAEEECAVGTVVGVRFYQEVNGQKYLARDKEYHALQIKEVFLPVQNESSTAMDSTIN